MRQFWSGAERRVLAQSYSQEGAYALAQRLGRSYHSVYSQARRYGLESKNRLTQKGSFPVWMNRSVNPLFFDQVTPQSIYTLGFIWACGSIRTKHRKILRLVSLKERWNQLSRVLALLNSKHQIQTYGPRLIVEICNSRLVEAVVEKYGIPPGRYSEGNLPRLDGSWVPPFAKGYLDARGGMGCHFLSWTGHPVVVSWLADQTQAACAVSEPRVSRWGKSLNVAWTEPGDVQEIQQWLENPPME